MNTITSINKVFNPYYSGNQNKMKVNTFTANDRGREKFHTVNTLHIFTFPNKTFRFAFLCREAPNQSVYTLSRDKTFITNHISVNGSVILEIKRIHRVEKIHYTFYILTAKM